WSWMVSPQAPSASAARQAEAAARPWRIGRTLAAIAVGDRHAPVTSEGARGDLDPGRSLAALVLGEVDEADGAVDLRGGEALGDQLLAALIELDVAAQDAVEQLVGGQGVLIDLIGAQLGGGWALDDRSGDRRLGALACRPGSPFRRVAPLAQSVDERLGHVLDD